LAFRLAILPFLIVTYVLAGVAFPAFAHLSRDLDRMRRAFRATMRVSTCSVFLAGAGLVVLAPYVQVLGTKWAPAVQTARVLGVYVCLRSVAHITTPLLQAVGAPGAVAWLRAAWVAMLALLIGTVGRYGIVAVGVVQVAVAAVLLVAHALTVRRLVGIDVRGFVDDIMRPAVAAVGACLVIALPASRPDAFPYTSWHSFLLLASLMALLYVAILMTIQPSMRHDARLLAARLRPRASS